MAKIIVSNCLLGCRCTYKGSDNRNDDVLKLAENNLLIGICPEQFGGLPTPRDPSEIIGDKVMSCNGKDVTENYKRGAETALKLAQINHADLAIMKARSPSCGKGIIYDGTFSKTRIPGDGITVRLLMDNGIPVFTEEEINQAKEFINKV